LSKGRSVATDEGTGLRVGCYLIDDRKSGGKSAALQKRRLPGGCRYRRAGNFLEAGTEYLLRSATPQRWANWRTVPNVLTLDAVRALPYTLFQLADWEIDCGNYGWGNPLGLKSIFLSMRHSLGLPWFGALCANLVLGGI
jgi:hypothetical protein